MASILNVDSIRNAAGTSAITIDSNGRVAMGNTVEIDMWRLPSAFSTNSAIINTWTRPTSTGTARAGTGMTHSSGYFTFPSTGLYRFSLSFRMFLISSDTSAGINVLLSTDGGSSTTPIAGAYENRNSNSSCHTQGLINVTDVSNFQMSFQTSSISSGGYVSGHSDRNETSIIFERITDSQ